MAKRDFAFGKENFILIAVAVAVIAIGFMLMSGGGSQDPTGFNPDFQFPPYCCGSVCDSDRLRIDDFRNFKKQQK